MADINITAANVAATNPTGSNRGIAGATITQGQVLYLDSSDSRLKLADANASAATKVPIGIALNAASAGQPVNYVSVDTSFTVGATLSIGDVLYLSATAGGITATYADLTTGMVVAVLGSMVSTTTANLNFTIGGTKA
jgi:hypothetical protein